MQDTSPAFSSPCLVSDGFGVAFGQRVILAELDFSLPPQGVTALLGPVGSGKSTLLRTLAGLNDTHPRFQHWGQVLYQGQPLGAAPRPRLVQQHARLMMASTLDALAEHVRTRLGLAPGELRAWCAAYVERMGFPELTPLLGQPTMELSPLHQRAVAILREAAAAPALLLVDEPTA